MSGRATDIEMAQSLLKEMGRESLLAYFTRRLDVGKDLDSRPLLLAAFARLAGSDSKQLLISVANDLAESTRARIAAARALGELIKQSTDAGERSEVTLILVKLLEDNNRGLRSAVATQLSGLQAPEAVGLLQQLIEGDKLDVLAREEVQKFLATVITRSVNLPPIPIPSFIGRLQELRALHEAFSQSPIVTLAGMGGMGTTSLAAMFARESNYDVKLWRSCRYSLDPADLANNLVSQLTEQLHPSGASQSEHKQINSLRFDWGRIQNQIVDLLLDRSALIVLDDYEEIREENEIGAFIERLVARLPRVYCLIVGRVVPRLPKGIVVRLEGLSLTDSFEVLRAAADHRNIYLDSNAAQKIAQLAY